MITLDNYFFVVTFGMWLVFVVIAIINAAVRNKVYKPVVGDLAAHQISTVIFVSLIFFCCNLPDFAGKWSSVN